LRQLSEKEIPRLGRNTRDMVEIQRLDRGYKTFKTTMSEEEIPRLGKNTRIG
jgi:hypothetical protein